MRTERSLRRLLGSAAAALAVALAPSSQAQTTNFWNSTTSGDDFNTIGNWVTAFTAGAAGVVPTGNEVAYFGSQAASDAALTGITNSVLINSAVSFGRLVISTNGYTTGFFPQAYRFGGTGSITLNGDGTGSLVGQELITVNAHNNLFNPVISNNIVIGLANGRFNVNNGRTLTLSGGISGAPGTALNFTNTGTLRLTGINSLDGGIRVLQGGIVDVNQVEGLGVAPAVFTADYVRLANGGTLAIRTNPATGGASLGSFAINPNMGITLLGASGIISTPAGNISITNDNQITGTLGTTRLIKQGASDLIISGTQNNIDRWRGQVGAIQFNSEASTGLTPGAPVADYFDTLTNGGLAFNFTGTLNANKGIAIGLTNGSLNYNAGIDVLGATNVLTYGGAIALKPTTAATPGTANFLKGGPGTLNLTGANTYNGITRIDAGYITDSSIPFIPGGTTKISYNGGGLRVANDLTIADPTIAVGSNNNARAVFFVEAGKTLTFNGTVLQVHTNPAAANNIISKNGPGTMLLGGNLNHFGGVEASNGVLVLSGVAQTYNGVSQAINANSRLSIGSPSNLGTNTIILNLGGLLATEDMTFGAANQRIQIGAANGNNGSIFEVVGGKTLTINSVLANQHTNSIAAGGIEKLGLGTLVLGNTNVYGGTTTVRDGTLSVTINEALGALAQGFNAVLATNNTGRISGVGTNFTISKGSFILNGTTQTVRDVNFTDNNAASAALSTATISGGDLMLQGNINYTGGPTNLLGQRETGASLLSANVQLMNNNKTITVNDSINATEELTISGTITGYADDDVSTGLRTLTKNGLGTLVLASPAGANSFSNTTVSAGMLKLGANDQLSDARSLTVTGSAVGGVAVGSTFDLNGKTETIGALSVGGGTVALVSSSASSQIIDSAGGGLLTMAGNLTFAAGTATNNQGMATISANLAISGNRTANINDSSVAPVDLMISGNVSGGSLNVTNTGVLKFTGANTFTSLTVSNGGNVINDGSFTGTVTVNDGGKFGGSGSSGALNVLGTGVLSPGSSPGTMTVNGDLSLASTAGMNFELDVAGIVGSGVNDLISVVGNLTLDGSVNIDGLASFGTGIYRLLNYTGTLTDNGLDIGTLTGNALGFAGNLTIDTATSGQVNLIVGVPEPSTVALAGIGAALLGLQVIRRRRNS